MEQRSRTLMLPFISLVFISAVNAELLHFKHQKTPIKEECDIFRGEWIFNPLEPPYTENCKFISNLQNCLKNGRAERKYLHWIWKPYDCDLPTFDPEVFLNTVKDKAFAFIGDSISRNQRESLTCLLSKVEEPMLVYVDMSTSQTTTWYFPTYNFTLASIWSPFLVKPESPVQIHLDIPDSSWTSRYHQFDYVLIGTGSWFQRPNIMLLENNTVVGCIDCKLENVTEMESSNPYQKAIELAFQYIIASEHKPLVIYRTHTPNHFENGIWNTGGYCNRTWPFKEGEVEGYGQDQLVKIGREVFAKSSMNSTRLKMLDIYHLSLLRPDGHPDKFRAVNGDHSHDCLHWCLPGAIDAWNYLMMEMILRYQDLKDSYY